MTRPVGEFVKEWLDSQGYPLEFRVATILEAAGFDVRQSVPYRLGEATREIDVLAKVPGPSERSLAIECKAGEGPWVVLGAPDGQDLVGRHLIAEPDADRDAWLARPDIGIILRPRPPHAYRLVRVRDKDKSERGQDEGHAAVSSAFDASLGIAASTFGRAPGGGPRGIIIPVVVVSEPLFSVARIKAPPWIEHHPTPTQHVLWSWSKSRRGTYLVEVVQVEHLEVWASGMYAAMAAYPG